LLTGHPTGLKDAGNIPNQLAARGEAEDTDCFEIAGIKVADNSENSGSSLAELNFRQKFVAPFLGIHGVQKQITTINPAEQLQGGDCLIVTSKAEPLTSLRTSLLFNGEPVRAYLYKNAWGGGYP